MPGLDGTQIRRRLAAARLYLCTDARAERGDLADFADAALRGGVDVVQLRDKGLEAKQEIAALEVLAEACARHGALLSVNDRADVAAAVDADVLHLGQDDLPVPVARRLLGEDVAIGRSTHDVPQMRAAAEEPGVDYFCTGPCWPTPTKPGRRAPGLSLVRAAAGRPEPLAGAQVQMRKSAGIPWFAIGGIDLSNLDQVLAAGATRIVVVRAVTAAEDPEDAARRLRSQLS